MRRTIVTVLALGLLHCGKATPATNGSSSGSTSASAGAGSGSGSTSGASGTVGGTVGGSSGSSGSATSGSSGGGSTGSYHGAVLFTLADLGAVLGTNHSVAAAFVDQNSPIPNDPNDCTGGTVYGSCCYRGGNGGTSGSSGSSGSSSSGSTGGSNTQYSAGDIAITDGSNSLGSMSPSSNGTYTPLTNATWSQGDRLTVTAAGDVVHSFTGSVVAPPQVSITSPVPSGPFNVATLSTSQPQLVTFSATGCSKFYTLLTGVGRSLTCVTDGHASPQVTLQSAALANFAGSQGAVLSVACASQIEVQADNASITVAASTAAGMGVQFTQ